MIKIKIKTKIYEVSDKERAQMGTQKGKYPYVSPEEYSKLRPYLVGKSQKRNKELDPELTAYTPGETIDLLKHPKIQAWFKRMKTFKIPDQYGLVIFVGCAATKPWGFSCVKGDFYPYYNQIRKEVQDGKMKPIYFVTLSEPLGVVPQDLWGDNPQDYFPQYDNPGLFKDTPLQTGMMTKDWEKSPLGSKREMPFDDEAYEKAIEELGHVIGEFINNNKNHQYISFVEHADSKKISSHSHMLDIAQQVSGIDIPRNPKKAAVGRSKTGPDVATYMKSKLPPEYGGGSK
jgi:hypothetical protein